MTIRYTIKSGSGILATWLMILLWFALMMASLYGWISNLIKIFGLWNDPVTTELIIRLIGVPVAVIGVFAGYF